jgi:hypothetical protein
MREARTVEEMRDLKYSGLANAGTSAYDRWMCPQNSCGHAEERGNVGGAAGGGGGGPATPQDASPRVKEALHERARQGGPQALREWEEKTHMESSRNHKARRSPGKIAPLPQERLTAQKPHSPKALLPKRSWHEGPPSQTKRKTARRPHGPKAQAGAAPRRGAMAPQKLRCSPPPRPP